MEHNQNQVKREVMEWVKAIVIAGVLVGLIRWFIFAPFIVDGPSMQPNFFSGERLIVNKLIYDFRPPQRGEVIVFVAPESKDYIKRVIALPGETVKVVGDQVFINGQQIDEPYIKNEIETAKKNGTLYNTLRNFKEVNGKVEQVKVPDNELFVMGDNRPNSKDSRFGDVGFVPYAKVIGRADFVFWPFDQIHFIKHSYEVNP
ncbi:signal peptidase I [Ferviditalea candida]|uniref:Signal peptidase I n=1 Tax=Ferviditalea candida TaxID=3108399 RepID=A0ABU5ZFC0_9BACL|nr:signal peptidase I [Paenibacillaceae bacterium T2]